MTRQEIERDYEISSDGYIVSPGKFEMEPIYAPYFWSLLLDGLGADEDDPTNVEGSELRSSFTITPKDIQQFPELKDVEKVLIHESVLGFVYCIAVDK